VSAYRTDPDWLEAQARWVADVQPGETADDAFTRRIAAVNDMHAVERRYELAALLVGGGSR